jgi:hypothetical protein
MCASHDENAIEESTMNSRIAVVGPTILVSILLLFSFGCDSRKKEAKEAAEKARKEAEMELEKVKERDKRAKEIIQKKFNTGAKFDSRFKDYATSDEDIESDEELESEEGTLKGYVAVWGSEPGTVGSTRGIRVSLRDEDGYYYYGWVDLENWYRISAPGGNYTLIIEEPGYKRFERSVTIEGGRERLVAPIGLQNE